MFQLITNQRNFRAICLVC